MLVSDLNIDSYLPLVGPTSFLEEIPRTDAMASFVAKSRKEINEVLFGDDDRFLVIAGPCSIHDVEAGKDYAQRFAGLAEEVKDRILLCMRVYFEKPRTTVGWKGLIMDPALDDSCDIPTGLRMARRFLAEVVDLGVPTATELLDPITPQYIADLVSWCAIGARTTESQTHRQMASGLSMPVGFKNATPGTINVAIHAIQAAAAPQIFLGVSETGQASQVTTKGNQNCHIILRGGSSGPNYGAEHVAFTEALLQKHGLDPRIMIDASHANCGKDDRKMGGVFRSIVEQRASGTRSIVAAMLESNIEAGAQKLKSGLDGLTYGQSITDKCISWTETEDLIREAHQKLG